jgi:hypothetical protein
MPHNDVLVDGVQHILEVANLPITLCCAVSTICEAHVHRGARPQVALPCHAIGCIGVFGNLLCTHAADVEIVDLGKPSRGDGAVDGKRR